MYRLYALCGLLTVLLMILLVKLYLMKKSIREIQEELEEKLATDTNTLIDISSNDRDLCRLAVSLNTQLKKLCDERHRFSQGDMEIKKAVSDISHDLRTPLTAICGYLDLLEKEETSEKVKGYLSQVANRTEVIKQLTEELFRYSVVASVKKLALETLYLNHVLEECIAAFYGAIMQNNITPQIAITDVLVERKLDKSALMRIFGNIISNAIKYSCGDLFIEMDEEGKITFSNTAKDLDAVEVGRLFDRFYTLETTKNATGLGLSIAKMLTKEMGGEIRAEYIENTLKIVVKF